MATEEHINLANRIKDVHRQLRISTKKIGAPLAWAEHLQGQKLLKSYSEAMENLATNYWESNHQINASDKNRIQWTVKYCLEYFFNYEIINYQRLRERKIMETLAIAESEDGLSEWPRQSVLNLLDVGSCYNPFQNFDRFKVTAIDIAPADARGVFECDFLNVPLIEVKSELPNNDNKLNQLITNSYDIVVFSLLLEYLPTSEQRKICCQKAYKLLNTEGILVVITPDSKHVGSNAKLMKNWRYTLALMGFSRIKYEKLEHISCMVFRKALSELITIRWAEIHKENYMENEILIPQDFNEEKSVHNETELVPEHSVENLGLIQELPDL